MAVFRRILSVLLVAGVVLLAGCGSSSKNGVFNAAGSQGTWSGTWSDSAGNSGTGQLIINVNQSAQSLAILASETGPVFGRPSPPAPQSLTGVYNTTAQTTQINTQTQSFGLVTVNIDQNGNVTGSLTAPVTGVTSVTLTGTATNSTLTIHFVASLASGGTTTGTAVYSKKSTSTTLPTIP